MSASQVDTLLTREQKTYNFDFSVKALIQAGQTLDNNVAPTIDVFVDEGPGPKAALAYGSVAFDVPNNIVQVQDVTPSVLAVGSTYIIKVTATTDLGVPISMAGAVKVQQYI